MPEMAAYEFALSAVKLEGVTVLHNRNRAWVYHGGRFPSLEAGLNRTVLDVCDRFHVEVCPVLHYTTVSQGRSKDGFTQGVVINGISCSPQAGKIALYEFMNKVTVLKGSKKAARK